MRWINKVESEFIINYKSLYLLIFFMLTMITLIFIYSKENNMLLGLGVNSIYYFIIVYMVYLKNKAIDESKNWISVNAEVLSVQIIHRNCIFSRNLPYYPRIKYMYFIDNTKYISNNMYLQKCHNYCFDEKDAIRLAKKTIKDRKLKCFVNPNNHEESIVITDVAKGSYFICFLLVYFISFLALIAEIY